MEKVVVRSAKQYFDIYAVNGIGKGMDRIYARNNLIQDFKKEIIGLVEMRAKKQFNDIPSDGDPEADRIVRNVVKDEQKKWIKICDEFAKYKETSNLLKYDDITKIMQETAKTVSVSKSHNENETKDE